MSKLLENQQAFAFKVAYLIVHAHNLGYQVTLGDAYRDTRLHGEMGVKKGYGNAKSFHKQRLAIDLNLFKDGKLTYEIKDYEPLGKYWESLDPKNEYGGFWTWKDAPHFQRNT